ncbi:hypothetical protein CCE28_05405 [Anaeromicrobium sediminis]|uniref:Uncharacterized protein n=1 Tax=Anaeromicrobium sediminis TaxID=1478221 RepID=A0A267MLP9_9FIRM|nr:hypothetical protein CCE28_05405 [Anaeromicrobium sediminis]
MFQFMEVIFPMIFLGYFFYFFSFLYCLIPMLIQIVFSAFIEGKHIRKIAIMILFTQGIIIPIVEMNHDMIYNMIHYSKRLGFRNVVM